MRYFNVLDNHNGLDFFPEWSLPVQKPDGSWKPGKWMPEVTGNLEQTNGYHVFTEDHLIEWLRNNEGLTEVEPSREMVAFRNEIACRSVRLLKKVDWNERIARLFMVDCARRALPIFEADYPKDYTLRRGIEVARSFAEGKATDIELIKAWEKIKHVRDKIVDKTKKNAYAAVWVAIFASVPDSIMDPTMDTIYAVRWAIMSSEDVEKEKKRQTERMLWYLDDNDRRISKGNAIHSNERT
jgi:hypothetical protein